MKTFHISFLLLLIIVQTNFPQNYSQYVNPFIGTGLNGHTYPGATVPFGMVQLSPTMVEAAGNGLRVIITQIV